MSLEYIKSIGIKELLFGVGISKSESVLNIAAHNFWLTILIEAGIIGLFFFIKIFKQLFAIKNMKIVLIPYFIATLSATNMAFFTFYVLLAIMVILHIKSVPSVSENS